jgi:hypothetical protein
LVFSRFLQSTLRRNDRRMGFVVCLGHRREELLVFGGKEGVGNVREKKESGGKSGESVGTPVLFKVLAEGIPPVRWP